MAKDGQDLLEEYKGMPREAILLIYASFLPALAFGMFYIDLSYFLTTVQGLSDILMGAIISVMGVTSVAAGIPLGLVADRYGRRKSLVLGNVLGSLSVAMFALTTNSVALLFLAIMIGISQAAFSAGGNALLAEKAGDAKRTLAFSLSSFVGDIGSGLGSFIIPSTVIFQAFGYGGKDAHILLYVVLGIFSLASTLLMLKVRESRSLRRSSAVSGLLTKRSKMVLIRYTLANSIIGFGSGMVVPLMTRWLYLMYRVPDAVSGPILGVSSFVLAAATLAVPALARRLGVVKAIVFTEGLSTFFMFATPYSPSYLVASVVYIVRRFLMNMSGPLQDSLVMGLVSEDDRGAASGISRALWRLPRSISTTIGAGLMGVGLLAAPFQIATILYIVAIAIFWFYFSKVKLPHEMTIRAA